MQFNEMLRKTISSPYFDSFKRFAAPLKDHFGVNHFWYFQISESGHYSYLGTHAAWSEYCFDELLLRSFPCLRHPSLLKKGISLMKAGSDPDYRRVLDIAWEKFNINFNINLISGTSQKMEAFGFATCHQDPQAEERLLNDLPLLRLFIKLVREKHKKLFHLLNENQVDLSAQLGSCFYRPPQDLAIPQNRMQFLKRLGLADADRLTPREVDVLRFISQGFPASFIAEQLLLSVRTVENYLVSIKEKLSCTSKVELIQKAQEIISLGLFD